MRPTWTALGAGLLICVMACSDDDANGTGGSNTGGSGTGGSNTGGSGAGSGAGGSGGLSAFAMDDLQYTGAFRFTNGDFGVSDVNYAVGVLAYNPDRHSLFIVGHAQQSAVAEYPIVAPGTQTGVADLPETGEPLQPFTDLLSTGGNPEAIDRITGMLWVDGALIVNAEQWYDAPGDNQDTSLVVHDAGDLGGARDGYFELTGRAECAGYLGAIPAPWQGAFGAEFYTGWSSVYSIISRYSLGPSLWTFTPGDMVTGSASTSPQITATAFINYAYDETHLSDRATEWEPQGSTGPFPPSSPLWNPLSRGRYGFFVPGTSTFAVIGSTAGLETGIGYKIVQDDGHLCGGPCPYGADDYYNYYWLFDVDEILAANEVFDPQPYAYGIWEVPFDEGGRHAVVGATIDSEAGTLYVALDNAGQLGDYDRPPLIVTYALP